MDQTMNVTNPDPTLTVPPDTDPPIFSEVQNGTADGGVPENADGSEESFTAEYRELTKLNSYVVKTVLDMLAGNPMIGPMLGPEFRQEAATVGERIGTILRTIDPENYPG